MLPRMADYGEREVVILLHGLGRTRVSMRWLGRQLRKNGFRIVNVGYPTLRLPVDELAARYLEPAVDECLRNADGPVHFVTHSLGAIVLRRYLQHTRLPPGSRAVMLAPPNQGSELADELREVGAYRWLTGPAGSELGTDAEGMPRRLGPIDLEVGVIAGRRSVSPLTSRILPGESDGKVRVESARLPEMADFLVVDAGHTFIMYRRTVRDAVVGFLRTGRFGPDAKG